MKINKFNFKTPEEIEQCFKDFHIDFPVPLINDKQKIRRILSQPLSLGKYTLKNRMAIQPMEGFDSESKGEPSELTKRRYKRFAESGASVIWFEAVAAVYEGRSNEKQLYITEANIGDYARQVEDIKKACYLSHGFEPLVIMQATHSGRYSKPDGKARPVIAYNKPLFEKENPIDKSNIISADGLKELTEKMGEAAEYAQKAGFDGVDIKCCHGYLSNELLSAYERDDEYGGSFENRTRFFTDSVKTAKARTSDFIVTSRMNAYDGFAYPDGFGISENGKDATPDLSETKRLIHILHDELKMPLMDITIGNPYVNPHVNRPADILPYEHTEHPLSGLARIVSITRELQKEFSSLPIIASAMPYLRQFSPNLAASMVESGCCSLAGFGRMAFAYPSFVSDILETGTLVPEKCCITCGNCSLLMRNGSSTGCVIKDRDLYYPLYKKYVPKEE